MAHGACHHCGCAFEECECPLTLQGPLGPMVAAPGYDIRSVLDALCIPYRVWTQDELNASREAFVATTAKLPPPKPLTDEEVTKRLEALTVWEDFMFGVKR